MSENAVLFRKAQLSDLADIVAMLADDDLGSGREDPSLPLAEEYLDAFRAIEGDPNQLLIVACAAGRVIGTMQISFIRSVARKGALRGQIEAVRVAADARGDGLGRKMFDWAITQCRARGCVLVQLTSDKARPGAHRFYESLGFLASHEGYKLAL